MFEPTDDVTIFGKLEYTKSRIAGSAFEFVPGGTRPDYRKNADDAFSPVRDNAETLNGVIQAEMAIGSHTLTAITGYSDYVYDQAFNTQAQRPARLVVDNGEKFTQWSQETRLLSPTDGAFDYVVGAYVEVGKSRVRRQSIFDFPFPPSPDTQTFRIFNQKTNVIAVFAQGNLRIGDQFVLAAGLRWTQIKKRGDVTGFVRPGGGPPINRLPLFGNLTESDPSPSATLTWKPDRDASIYLKCAKGNKGGTLSELQNATAATFILRPEKSTAFEFGAKAQIPSVGAFLNLAVFTTDYSDL